MDQFLSLLNKIKIIPVIKINSLEKIPVLGEILLKNNILLAEITLRTGCAFQAIKEMNRIFPQIMTGAGTVLQTGQLKTALDHGARFIVSPGFNSEIVSLCRASHIPVVPGVMTPTEIERGLNHDLQLLKFFPAQAAGGVNFLKSIAPVYPQIKFIPTGGINLENLNDYLTLKNVPACGASWFIKPELIDTGRFDIIDSECRKIDRLISELQTKTKEPNQ